MSALYRDELIEVIDAETVFHCYYFPFGNAKHVPLNQIESIQTRPPSFFGGSWRLWGSGDFLTWFQLDGRRPGRDRLFFVALRNRSRRIGFTVEDSQRVISILRELVGLLQETPANG